ncbi:MAG: acyl carrier protein [Planctomycetes bacterium]|nr:acyl carrier protein [Planctomycetota bacterium]
MQIQSEIRNYIIENILFGDEELLDVDTSFQENGILDSLGFLEIITFVEEKFGIEIADNEVVPENLGSLRRISSFVEEKLNEKAIV